MSHPGSIALSIAGTQKYLSNVKKKIKINESENEISTYIPFLARIYDLLPTFLPPWPGEQAREDNA